MPIGAKIGLQMSASRSYGVITSHQSLGLNTIDGNHLDREQKKCQPTSNKSFGMSFK